MEGISFGQGEEADSLSIAVSIPNGIDGSFDKQRRIVDTAGVVRAWIRSEG